MAKLEWDKTGNKFYETGVQNVALYPFDSGAYSTGVAWNGVTAITKSPSGAEANPIYADNTKYLNIISLEEFGFTIEAYTYPPEFEQCDGSADLTTGVTIGQQGRKMFGLAFKTLIGNDENGNDHGYKIHLIYGANASPSEQNYNTVNDSPDPTTMSWECTTTPVAVTGMKPTSCVVIDSRTVDSEKLKAFEETLWGNSPSLPLPDAVKTAFSTGGTM